MADPISMGAQQALQQVEQVQKQVQTATQNGPEASQFQAVMEAQQTAAQNPATTQVQPTNEITKLAVQDATGTGYDVSRLGVKPVEGVKESALKNMMRDVVEGQNKLDDIIKVAVSGRSFSNQELLAVQAAVYKFSQELDLTSKVVEKATSGIKQTLQTQV